MALGELNGHVTGNVTFLILIGQGRDPDIFGCKCLGNG